MSHGKRASFPPASCNPWGLLGLSWLVCVPNYEPIAMATVGSRKPRASPARESPSWELSRKSPRQIPEKLIVEERIPHQRQRCPPRYTNQRMAEGFRKYIFFTYWSFFLSLSDHKSPVFLMLIFSWMRRKFFLVAIKIFEIYNI